MKIISQWLWAMLLCLPLCAAASIDSIAQVKRLSGKAIVTTADGTTRALSEDDALMEGDIVNSEPGAEVLIVFRDESKLILREKSTLSLDQFRYTQSPEDNALVTSLLKGSLRYVSGLVGKLSARKVRFVAPNSTIGIRGTDLEIALVAEGELSRAGEYNYVYDGGTNMRLDTGEALDVDAEQTGFAPLHPEPGEARLQLLKEKPAFIRGGGFDAMMLQITRPMPVMPRRY